MKIIEYKLHAPMNGHGMSTPSWVASGGAFYNQDDYTMISANPDTTEYYVPDTVVEYTVAELKARQLALHAKYTNQKWNSETNEMEDMTDAEVEATVDAWVAANS